MAKEQDFILAIDAVNNSGKSISFAELAAKIYKDKIVEVYVGDTFEDIKYDDSTQKYAAVLVGKVITAYAECLVLNCAYMDQNTKTMKIGNIVCLNERGIRTITEVDESGVLRDTFLSTRDSKIVKGLFGGK
jgi:hypothetical protein